MILVGDFSFAFLDKAALREARGIKTNSRDQSSREKPPQEGNNMERKHECARDRVAMPRVKTVGKCSAPGKCPETGAAAKKPA